MNGIGHIWYLMAAVEVEMNHRGEPGIPANPGPPVFPPSICAKAPISGNTGVELLACRFVAKLMKKTP